MRRILILTMAVVLMAACAESKKSRGQASTRRARTQNPSTPAGGGSAGSSSLNCTGDAWGVIFADSETRSTWQDRVVNFASASVPASEVGFVSPDAGNTETGISFCGRICSRNPGSSEVYIGIWDKFFADGVYPEEIAVNIKAGGANGGQFFAPAKFSDVYGDVEFVGTSMPGGTAEGDFYFLNRQRVGDDGNYQPVNGVRLKLGRFRILSDRFWRTDC